MISLLQDCVTVLVIFTPNILTWIIGYNYLLEHDIRSLMAQSDSLKSLHVATGMLDAMIKPLTTHKEMHGQGPQFKDIILSIVLWIIQALQEHTKGQQTEWQHIHVGTVTVKGHGQIASLLNSEGFQFLVKTNSKAKPARGVGNRGGTLPKTIVLSALKALQNLGLLFPDTVEQSVSINIVLSILFDTKLCADQRVFKACLATLPIVLKTKVRNGHLLDGQLFSSAMKVVMKLLNEPTSSSTLLRLILTAVQEFFADDTLGRVLVQEVSITMATYSATPYRGHTLIISVFGKLERGQGSGRKPGSQALRQGVGCP